jgi:aspartate kinase
MIVYKFGGASVKDAGGIRNLARIVSEEKENLLVVVSAFGKTTNALESVLKAWISGDEKYKDILAEIYGYHRSIADELLPPGNPGKGKIDDSFSRLEQYLKSSGNKGYDFEYDQIVSNGEIWSTIIVASFLDCCSLNAEWTDIRGGLITDDRFRDADILWSESPERIRNIFSFKGTNIYVTQGFIGGTVSGHTTTLGREGSDYTAALLANILDADKVVVWKDVPGLLNADPKWLAGATRLEEVSYREAVEMTFSGAKVIHPKTIKPLHNKNIPLHVKSFITPEQNGTLIKAETLIKHGLPIFIRKEDQIMISLVPKDFSFAMGEILSRIFHLFEKNGIKVNVVDASAVSINVCVDDERMKVESTINELKHEFLMTYNENAELLSIRHYTAEAIERITKDREILLEQRTRNSVRFVVRKIASPR